MADYAETLLQAVEILINKKIESIKFDETVNAVITDANQADDGIYTVEFNGTKFTAYSNETKYKENDSVMVTIPQGNFENQKMIIGKCVSNTETPLTYKSPMEQLVNLTTNLIGSVGERHFFTNTPGVTSDHYDLSFYANDDNNLDLLWDIDEQQFSPKKTVDQNEVDKWCWWEWSIPAASQDTSDAARKMLAYQRYSRIAISAQFSTWLDQFQTVTGNYGLALELTFQYLDVARQQDRYFTKILTLDSEDFFGNVYNFETYYTQAKVYDLSSYVDFPIVKMRLFPYQRSNFYDIYKEQIPSPSNSQQGVLSNIVPNIFIKDPMICLGIDTSEFEADYATLECLDDTTLYHKTPSNNESLAVRDAANEKHARIRWIHKDDVSEFIQLIDNDNMPANYEIRWYRNRLGAASPDIFAGAHWERLQGAYKSSPTDDGSYNIDTRETDVFTDKLEVIIKPDVNAQTSQIKAIVVRKEENNDFTFICATNVLTFTNKEEVRNNATIVDTGRLAVAFEDGTNGNYFIYNRAGQLNGSGDTEVRVLQAKFDTNTTSSVFDRSDLVLDSGEFITWKLPYPDTSMIQLVDIGSVNGKTTITPREKEDGSMTFTSTSSTSVSYVIRKSLKTSFNDNTIEVTVHKDGQDYTTFVTMRFGTAGTSGSDYTLLVDWETGKNALVAAQNETLIGYISLRDSIGDIVEIPNDATLEVEVAAAASSNDDVNTTRTVGEKAGVKYPVFQNGSDRIISDIDYYYTHNSATLTIPNNNNNNYYTYSMEDHKFIKCENNQVEDLTTNIIYKASTSDGEKNKFEFVAINNNDQWTSHKYFVQDNGIFILDPWDIRQETETYYKPKEVKIHTITEHIAISGVTGDAHSFTITAGQNINMGDLYILKITLSNFGDYDLVTQVPLALKSGNSINSIINDVYKITDDTEIDENKTYYTLNSNNNSYESVNSPSVEDIDNYFEKYSGVVDSINGATCVRYATSGEIDFEKEPYEIHLQGLSSDNKLIYLKDSDISGGYWKLLYYLGKGENNSSLDTKPEVDKRCSFLPSLSEGREDNGKIKQYTSYYKQSFNNNDNTDYQFTNSPVLIPPSVYFKDAPLYGVQFCLNNDNTVLWTQPILVYQDNYPSTTLNKWDGKEVQIDKDQGTIVANGFAAGKKESDNTFTGVVLGDWSRSDTDAFVTKQTGVYGFNHGAMSYALKDDGTAFFGKDGSGRIYFNGNSAQIYSAGWIANKDDKKGMLIDVDDGYIKMIGIKNNNNNNENSIDTTEVILSSNTSPYFKIGLSHTTINNDDTRTTTLNPLINIGDNDYYLQSENFSPSPGAGVKFDLHNGQLTGYNLKIHAKRKVDASSQENTDYNPTYSQPYYSWNSNTTNWNNNSSYRGNTDSAANASAAEVQLDSSAINFPFKIGSNFKVSWNGFLDAAQASFDGLSARDANISTLGVSSLTAYSGTFDGPISAGGHLTVSNVEVKQGDNFVGVIGAFDNSTDHLGMRQGSSGASVVVYSNQISLSAGSTGSININSPATFDHAIQVPGLQIKVDGIYKTLYAYIVEVIEAKVKQDSLN